MLSVNLQIINDEQTVRRDQNETNEWKLTLKSDACKDFTVNTRETTCDCETGMVEVPWKNAAHGNHHYISAIITDADKTTVKYYGNLQGLSYHPDVTGNKGTAEVNIKGKLGEGDRLFIFNEVINPDKKTDYASELMEIGIDKPGHSFDQEKVEEKYLKNVATIAIRIQFVEK